MNRLVLIGNGLDLAHGLKTSYADFIHWYWQQRIENLANEGAQTSDDGLCSFEMKVRAVWGHLLSFTHKETKAEDAIRYMEDQGWCSIHKHPLLDRITTSIETKGWVDIEQDYYDILKEYAFRDPNVNPKEPPIKALNQQLRYLQQLLVEYLGSASAKNIDKISSIENAIYAPINTADVSVDGQKFMKEHAEYWSDKGFAALPQRKELFGIVPYGYLDDVEEYKKNPQAYLIPHKEYPLLCRLPNSVMLLNFNYTHVASRYIRPAIATINQIHGDLFYPESIIFGYGDELDDKFKELKAHKNNACLSHVKSIKYLEAPNYRQMLSFIESEPFQVLIMGHSCGNSDRTLLNTIFEHPNCVSIKPYYYFTDKKKNTDNYIELVQHISRNFNDMKLMRDRVVNKTQCEPLVED